MREVMFRGKQVSNGEWAYGYYVSCAYLTGNTIGHCIVTFPGSPVNYHEVYARTVGQYTGMKDKNGVRIYEGDIIEGQGSKAKTDHFVIRWNAAKCGFSAGEGKHVWPNLNQATMSAYEVIGNIHDNPELLEGGQPS